MLQAATDGGRHVAVQSWRNCGLGKDHSPGPFPGNPEARLGLEPKASGALPASSLFLRSSSLGIAKGLL